jgi:hypothetical protein
METMKIRRNDNGRRAVWTLKRNPMRPIGLACLAMTAMTCSPAAADCYLYKVIIGNQAAEEAPQTTVPVTYDMRAKTYTISGTPERSGQLMSFCEKAVVVLYEKSEAKTPAADEKHSTKDDGVCWLTVNDDKTVAGSCFRTNAQAVTMTGTAY